MPCITQFDHQKSFSPSFGVANIKQSIKGGNY